MVSLPLPSSTTHFSPPSLPFPSHSQVQGREKKKWGGGRKQSKKKKQKKEKDWIEVCSACACMLRDLHPEKKRIEERRRRGRERRQAVAKDLTEHKTCTDGGRDRTQRIGSMVGEYTERQRRMEVS